MNAARTKTCIYCADIDNCDLEDRTEEVCTDPNDKCFALYNDDNEVIQMGCLLKGGQLDWEDNPQIFVCDGELCNDELPKPTMCMKCNSNLDPKCATEPSEVKGSERCTQRPYTECYMRLNSGENSKSIKQSPNQFIV